MKAMRDAWAAALVDVARTNPNIVLLDADLANSTKADLFAEAFPERFFQMGIAEQNMVGVAVGLSTVGFTPWVATFAVFLTHRAVDQIRVSAAQTHANVKFAAAYAGLLTGLTGKTHQDVQDLAIMRAMPGMTVLAPADEVECAAMVRWASETEGPVYLRIARDGVTPVFDSGYCFVPGRVHLLREGKDVLLVSTGPQSSRCKEAAELLGSQGISAAVLHVPSIKPVDVRGLVDTCGSFDLVVTIEEHSIYGGLGGLVAEVLGEHSPRRVVRWGIEDRWGESAPNDFLLEAFGLSPSRLCQRVKDLVTPP